MKIRNLALPLAALIAIAAGATTANAQYGAAWRIDVDNTSHLMTYSVTDPVTPLGIEHDMTIQTGADGMPTGGTIVFKDGARRTMSQQEAMTYWTALGGTKSLWDRWQSDGRLQMITSKQAVPSDWLDRQAQVLTNTGVYLYGILSATSTSGQFALRNDNSSDGPVPFTMDAIQQIQEMRGATPAISGLVR